MSKTAAATSNSIQQNLGHLSGRLSRGLQRRLGDNVVSSVLARLQRKTFSSRSYWEQRYLTGGNSGAGSFGKTANFKARVVNDFIQKNNINSVLELGCGDGNQLELYSLPTYHGFDVAQTAVDMCRERFHQTPEMSFHLYPDDFRKLAPQAELCLSIDVLFHLVEDKVFKIYLDDLFNSSTGFVMIFSTAFDKRYNSMHQVDRDFRQYIALQYPDFTLDQTIINPNKGDESQADFFVYRRFDSLTSVQN